MLLILPLVSDTTLALAYAVLHSGLNLPHTPYALLLDEGICIGPLPVLRDRVDFKMPTMAGRVRPIEKLAEAAGKCSVEV